ncbi:MAG TPA: transposase, partial [Chthoniobacterales bacterium]
MVISLKSGTPVRSGGKEYTLQHILDGGTVVAMNVESGQREVLPIVSLQPTEGADRSKDLKTISDEDWDIARQRFAAIYPLISKKRPPQGAYLVQASKHNVHFGTIYHWRRCFLKDGLLNALLPQPRGPKAGEKVLDSVIEDVIAKTIKELYLSIQRPSMKKVYEEVLLRCRAAGLKAPHYNTIRHRIAELDKFSVAREREGLEVAEGRFKPNEGSLVADFPLATVQVDHTLLDITIVDEVSRLPIGRVWITVVFDVFSRMVLGFYLSLDPPGDISVGLALGRAILRKESWLAELKLDAEWDAFGIPSCLHMDNAKEFRGKMLKRACEKYGIGIDWRPVKKPRWGAHIERYMARFAEELKAIPGATFSN